MRQLAFEAFKQCDLQLGRAEAVARAEEFVIPQETVNSDEKLFRAHGLDFGQMVRRRLTMLAPNRLSRTRIESTIALDNPERSKLFKLSDKGIPLLLDPSYKANGDEPDWPPLASTYKETSTAVNRCFMENFHDKGSSFVLTKATVKKIIGIGLSKAGCINSKYTKNACDEKWDPFEHPTLESIVRMVLEFYDKARAEDPSVTWDNIVLWKMDLNGAFTLLSFVLEAVPKMCLELTGDLVMFILCGIFNWTGTPAAFQVITRTTVWELRQRIHGLA
jgi:hypothetical protein